MTNKEMVYYLEHADITVGQKCKTKTAEAIEKALKILKSQPCEDCISRKKVLDIITDWFACGNIADGKPTMRAQVKALPSVKPKQTKYNEIITQIEQARDKDKNAGEYPYNRCIEIIKGVNDGLH